MTTSLLIAHGQVFTLGAANELIPDGAIYVEGDAIAEVGPTTSLAAKYPAAERLDAAGKIVLPASDLRAHAFLRRVRARHGDPRDAGHQFRGDPAEAVVEARPGAVVGRRPLQRADLPGRCDPPRLHDVDRPPRQPERHRRQPGHHRGRGEGGRAARQPVLRGHRPQRAGRRAGGHRRKRPLPEALPG